MKLNLKTGRYYKEIWKDVIVDREKKDTYKGLYMVSNMGRVKSLHGKEKILKPGKYKNGYLHVDLCKNSKSKRYLIHRLVALAFIPNLEKNKKFIDHKNTIRTDNRACNLRWCTNKENNNNEITKRKRSERAKGKKFTEEHKKKLSEAKAIKVICITTNKIFDTITEAREYYGIKSTGNITSCCQGKRKSAGKLPDGTKLQWKYYEDYLKKMK